MFPSAGPILLTLFLSFHAFSFASPLPIPPARDAPSIPFLPLNPRAPLAGRDEEPSVWVPRSKLDQMDRRSIQSHRFRDTDTGKRLAATTRGRSTSFGRHARHRAISPRASLNRIDLDRNLGSSQSRDQEREFLLVQRQESTLGDFVDLGSSQLADAKVLFATTITQAGPQATGVSGAEGAMVVEVIPSSSEMQTSEGTITEFCLTMVSDPTQKFCSTTLDGQVLGSDAGLAQSPPSGPGDTSSAPTVESPSASDPGVAAAVVTDSASDPSASIGGAEVSASESIGAVVNAADPTAGGSSTPDPSSTQLGASSAGTEVQVTASPVVVNDPATSAGLSSLDTSAAITGSPIVVNGPAASSAALSPSAIMLNAPTSSPSGASGGLITAPSSAASVVVVNAPPATSSTAAAAAQENAAAATIPGQKLQVLPIGLGIFGGLAGITLLVVGYVYWERRKYKRQFRTRKAAEKKLMDRAAPMGSSGYGAA